MIPVRSLDFLHCSLEAAEAGGAEVEHSSMRLDTKPVSDLFEEFRKDCHDPVAIGDDINGHCCFRSFQKIAFS